MATTPSRPARTEDAGFRFGLALATADEARHADALNQYARAIGGEPEDCADLLQPMDDILTAPPHMGRALVHTMLEGIAADEFHLLRRQLGDDPLGRLYGLIRRDEIQHVAIGLIVAQLRELRSSPQDWTWVADSDLLTYEFLQRAGEELRAVGAALAMLDIEFYCYPLVPLPAARADELVSLATTAGFTASVLPEPQD